MITTEDGSCGSQGLVTHALHHLLASGTHVDLALAVGPLAMMKAVAAMTRPAAIRTIVSLNPIMIDGTGMCGGCRVLVDGESKFACVDGPEFDGHAVDFDRLLQRNSMYRAAEQTALAQWRESLQGSSRSRDPEPCCEGSRS
jgi:ferredoxin--NADP+ reductase